MKCPRCRDRDMQPRLTTTGVELDNCKRCDSVWMDKGEIFLHVKPKDIPVFNDAITAALRGNEGSSYKSPKSGQTMAPVNQLSEGK